jgi:antitoxin (DNA-binding transcriptional repressor) of toxin-antitoxin stability system
MRSVSAREANQQFARILGEAPNGEEIVITRGHPVTILAPCRRRPLTAEQQAAIEEVVQMMKLGSAGVRAGSAAMKCTSGDDMRGYQRPRPRH